MISNLDIGLIGLEFVETFLLCYALMMRATYRYAIIDLEAKLKLARTPITYQNLKIMISQAMQLGWDISVPAQVNPKVAKLLALATDPRANVYEAQAAAIEACRRIMRK